MSDIGKKERGRVFVISSPSGTGKTTLVEMLCDEFENCVRSISCTTRSPRAGERDGEDYIFLSKVEFLEKEHEGAFLETAKVFDHYYGTLKETVSSLTKSGKHVFLVIDTQGALKLKREINACFIFVLPPSLEELEKRLKKRATETDEARELRLSWSKEEMVKAKEYDYQLVNDDLNKAYKALKDVVVAET